MVAGGISHGDEEARDVCLSGEGPRFTLGGHVHRPLGFWGALHETVSLNPGRGDNNEIPNHIVLDLKKQTMTHHQATSSGVRPTTFKFAL